MDNRVTQINFDTLRQMVQADYEDGDILLLDDIKEVPSMGTLQVDIVLAIICTEGKLQVEINDRPVLMQKGDMLLCPPKTFVNDYMLSPNFSAHIIGISYRAAQHMLHMSKDIWNMVMYVIKTPVYHLTPEDYELMECYYALMACKLRHPNAIYQREAMHALFQAVFYDMCSILFPLANAQTEQTDYRMKRGDQLVRHFLNLLAENAGRERSVTAYASQLCVTPKYLTSVCKSCSGKTALEWIYEYATNEIVQQLKYTDRSIKEIANDLNFPNISFFGKFVKARLGLSPTAYRSQLAAAGRKQEQ